MTSRLLPAPFPYRHQALSHPLHHHHLVMSIARPSLSIIPVSISTVAIHHLLFPRSSHSHSLSTPLVPINHSRFEIQALCWVHFDTKLPAFGHCSAFSAKHFSPTQSSSRPIPFQEPLLPCSLFLLLTPLLRLDLLQPQPSHPPVFPACTSPTHLPLCPSPITRSTYSRRLYLPPPAFYLTSLASCLRPRLWLRPSVTALALFVVAALLAWASSSASSLGSTLGL